MQEPASYPEGVAHTRATCCWCGSAFVRSLVAETATWLCPTEACWQRQVRHALFATLKGGTRECVFVPLPRQVEFFESTEPFVLFGGAAGGAKSKALRYLAYRECLRVPGFRVLLLRRTYGELEQTHLRDAEMEAPKFGAVPVPSANLVRFPNGSLIQFGHCQTTGDAARYLSAEYDLILFDELVTFEEGQYLLIGSRARSTKPGIVPRVLAGTNPGGPQAHWVRARFLDRTVSLADYPEYREADYRYIQSKLEDNPYFDERYDKQLASLPPELRRAYREGDWDVFPGQYFPEFRKTHRVIEADTALIAAGHEVGTDIPWHVERLTVPEGTGYVCAVDWGYWPDPGVCLWIALLPDGRAYVADEYVFQRTLDKHVAATIAARTLEMGIRVRYTVGDTQMWTPNTSTGQSIQETFAAHGVPMLQADKDRVNGWQRLRDWFAPNDVTGTPWMVVAPHCRYTIRTIPTLVMDKNNVLDVDSDGEDHAADPLRYFAMSRPAAGTAKSAVSYPKESVGALIQQAVKKVMPANRRWGRVA